MWRYTGRVCIGVRRHSLTFIISRARVLDSIHCLPTSIVLSRVSSSWDVGSKKKFSSSAHINTIAKVTEKEDMGAKGTHTVDTTLRLQNIRTLMRQGDVNVDAYVVPSEDQRECLNLPLSRWSGTHDLTRFKRVSGGMWWKESVHLWIQRVRWYVSWYNESSCLLTYTTRMCDHHTYRSLSVHRWKVFLTGRETVGFVWPILWLKFV